MSALTVTLLGQRTNLKLVSQKLSALYVRFAVGLYSWLGMTKYTWSILLPL
jgi:hypothetical protein